ncbi:MAG: S8 family serine peptidase [Patescibacteria group bacterium]
MMKIFSKNRLLFLLSGLLFLLIILFFLNNVSFLNHLIKRLWSASLSAAVDQKNSVGNEAEKYNGYIVEFTNDPSIIKYKDISSSKSGTKAPSALAAQSNISLYDNTLKSNGASIEVQIKKALKKDVIKTTPNLINKGGSQTELKVLGRYYKTFFGATLDITDAEAQIVKTIPGVKNVYKNYEVKANLMDAVPLIGANKVWQFDSSGNNCASSGKECLTGKNVTIAVIDTGIDYSHQDLGGDGTINERTFEKITTTPMVFKTHYVGFLPDQIIGMDENRLLYISNCKINIYNFLSRSTEIFNAPENYCPEVGVLKGDYIAYTANNNLNYTISKIYLLNLKSGVSLEIANLSNSDGIYGKIELDGNYLIYNLIRNGDSTNSSLILYKIDEKKEVLIDNGWVVSQSIDKGVIAYTILDANSYPSGYYLYNISSGNKIEFNLPRQGNILDYKNNEIIYSIYSANFKGYGVYNTETGNSKFLLIDEASNINNVNGINEIDIKDYGKSWSIMDAQIEKGYYFYSNDRLFKKVYLKDDFLNRTIQINLQKNIGDFDTEDNKICFVAEDYNIYCFYYDPKINYSQPLLQFPNSKVVGGYDFVNNDISPMDDHGHGTHVAGIVAGSGVGGLKGVAPDAKLYAYKVLNSGGVGSFSNIISAIDRAVDPNNDNDFSDKVDVMNLSLGGQGNPDDPLSIAIDNAVNAGVVAVVAAGNSGPNEKTIGSPGTARKAITVGATDKFDKITSFSSRGPVEWIDSSGNNQVLIKPDIVAPGVNICSSEYDSAWSDKKCLDDKHVAISGTSMATPMVTGSVALLKQMHPDWTPDKIKITLMNTAKNLGYNINTQGYGRIDIIKALNLPQPLVVTVFKDINYKGVSQEYGVGSYTLSQMRAKGTLNDDISSVKVAPGYIVTFYLDDNFKGASIVKTADDSTLVDDTWNDKVSSMIVALGSVFSNSQIYNDANSKVPALSCTNYKCNGVFGYCTAPCGGGYYPDNSTAQKLCQKKGYDSASSFTIKNSFFASCGDNYMWKWNGAAAEYIWSCAKNSGIDTVICSKTTSP